MQALLVNPPQHPLPSGISDLVRDLGWSVTTVPSYRAALQAAGMDGVDAVFLPELDRTRVDQEGAVEFDHLIRLLDARRVATVMMSDNPRQSPSDSKLLIDTVSSEVSIDELRGRLAMIERYHGTFTQMERELANMQRLGKRLNERFQEVDGEMRLAGRLQRDFLPNLSKPFSNVRFSALYRPVSWVSGDLYDVFRVDESHIGFYIADAVGHGMAAGLLTMFIKRSIVPKRIDGDEYRVLEPSEVLAELNRALTEQVLPNCQFVTACYCLLNHKTLTLRYARGGHPHPLLFADGGAMTELKASGGLLGIFEGEEFQTFETNLDPGDKILLFTDGVELALQSPDGGPLDTTSYVNVFESVGGHPVDRMMHEVGSWLDQESGSLNPRDDVTLVGLEVLKD